MTVKLGSASDIKGDFAQTVHCGGCRVPLNQTEKIGTIELNKKLVDRKAESFMCKNCIDTNREPLFAHRIEVADGNKTVLESRVFDLPDFMEKAARVTRSRGRSTVRRKTRSKTRKEDVETTPKNEEAPAPEESTEEPEE